MDCLKNLDNSTYVISLDSLDLALLPISYTSKLNHITTPLWTANNSKLNPTDYFEFEVKSKNETTISEDDVATISDTVNDYQSLYQSNISIPSAVQKDNVPITICHICDINVPIAYLEDHENSMKHKAYLKIADVVLNRTRKHMLKKNTKYIQKNDTMYFCGPCASEVQLVNKHSHDKSKIHKQSVSLDRLLSELVALYTVEEHEYDEDSSMETNNKRFVENIDYIKTGAVNEVKNDNNTVVISDIRARLDEFQIKTIENFIKIIDEYDTNKPYILSSVDNDLKITMEDGCEVIVADDNFNGFARIDENFILCILCKMIVGDEKAHKISDTHIKSIVTPFTDQHCLRNVDNSSSHCVICNKIVGNSDLHVLCDKTHTELLQKALVNKPTRVLPKDLVANENKPNEVLLRDQVLNENQADERGESAITVLNGDVNDLDYHNPNNNTDGNRLLKSITMNITKPLNTINPDAISIGIEHDTYFCPTCNIKMHVKNIESHMNGNEHAMASKSNLHYIMKQDIGSVDFLCRVCNIYVADDTNKIKEHVTTSDHVYKYKNLLKTNYVNRQNGNFYCKPCDLVVLKMNELFHIEKLSHQTNLACFDETGDAIQTVKENTNVNNGNNICQATKAPNKILSYYCDICSVYIPNNPNNINSHNYGLRHKTNYLKTVEDLAEPIKNNGSVAESLDVHYQMDATENEKTVMCKVCKVAVPNIDVNITEHVTGKKHESSLKVILDTNNIKCEGEKYYCKDCKVYVKEQHLFIHINQTQHKALLRKSETGVNATETTSTATSKEILNSPSHQKDNNDLKISDKDIESIDATHLKFKHHFIESEDKEWLQCKICFDMDIPNTAKDVASHTAKQKHLNGYKNLMCDNFIFETQERTYFCAICVCLVPLKGEVLHAKSQKHANKFVNATRGESCNLCNINTSGISMSDHVTSPEHIDEVLKQQSLLYYCMFCKLLMHKDKSEDHQENCHKFAVKDKICFCTICDPYLPNTSWRK